MSQVIQLVAAFLVSAAAAVLITRYEKWLAGLSRRQALLLSVGLLTGAAVLSFLPPLVTLLLPAARTVASQARTALSVTISLLVITAGYLSCIVLASAGEASRAHLPLYLKAVGPLLALSGLVVVIAVHLATYNELHVSGQLWFFHRSILLPTSLFAASAFVAYAQQI